jgi:hypothetical protein
MTVAAQIRTRRGREGRQAAAWEGRAAGRTGTAAGSAVVWRDQAAMIAASSDPSSGTGVFSSLDSSAISNGRCRYRRAPSGGRSGRRSSLSSSMIRGPS